MTTCSLIAWLLLTPRMVCITVPSYLALRSEAPLVAFDFHVTVISAEQSAPRNGSRIISSSMQSDDFGPCPACRE
jgi:hypothetical protein